MESLLELDARQTTNGPVYFDIAYNRSRLFVPLKHRRAVFTILHQQARGGSAATARIGQGPFRVAEYGPRNTAMGQYV